MEHLEAIYQEKLLRQELYVWQADGQGEWCDVVVDDWIEGITLYEAVMRGAGSGDKAHLSNWPDSSTAWRWNFSKATGRTGT